MCARLPLCLWVTERRPNLGATLRGDLRRNDVIKANAAAAAEAVDIQWRETLI